MADDLEQTDRRTFIGASEAPAACGVDPFRSRCSLYMSKVYAAVAQEETEEMALGNALEPGLARLCAERMSLTIGPGGQHKGANGILRAQPDRIAVLGPRQIGLIEAKTTGLEGWRDPEDGASAVPPKVLVQVAAQMYCIPDAVVAWVPVLIGRFGLKLNIYQIERAELEKHGIIENVAAIVADFWNGYVSVHNPPPVEEGVADLDVLRRIVRTPGKTVVLPTDADALLAPYEKLGSDIAGMQRERDRMKAIIVRALENAERGVGTSGAIEYREIIQHRQAQEAKEISTRRLFVKLNPAIIPAGGT